MLFCSRCQSLFYRSIDPCRNLGQAQATAGKGTEASWSSHVLFIWLLLYISFGILFCKHCTWPCKCPSCGKTSREWLITHGTQHHKQQTIVTRTDSNICAAAPGPPHVVKRPGFQPCLVLTGPCEMSTTFSSTHIKLWLACLTNNAKAFLIYRHFKNCAENLCHITFRVSRHRFTQMHVL